MPVKSQIDYIFFLKCSQSGYGHKSSSADLIWAQPHCTWQRILRSCLYDQLQLLGCIFPVFAPVFKMCIYLGSRTGLLRYRNQQRSSRARYGVKLHNWGKGSIYPFRQHTQPLLKEGASCHQWSPCWCLEPRLWGCNSRTSSHELKQRRQGADAPHKYGSCPQTVRVPCGI